MTAPGRQNDPEAVLSQALRAMAGGGRKLPVASGPAGPGPRLTTLQVILLALIVGLVVGMAVGIVTLLA